MLDPWSAEGAEGAGYPPSVIATLKPGKPLRMAFGSCRTSVDHGQSGNATHGVDALRSLALKMATKYAGVWPLSRYFFMRSGVGVMVSPIGRRGRSNLRRYRTRRR